MLTYCLEPNPLALCPSLAQPRVLKSEKQAQCPSPTPCVLKSEKQAQNIQLQPPLCPSPTPCVLKSEKQAQLQPPLCRRSKLRTPNPLCALNFTFIAQIPSIGRARGMQIWCKGLAMWNSSPPPPKQKIDASVKSNHISCYHCQQFQLVNICMQNR